MIEVLLVLHVFVTIALIGVVLIQRSEGGGLGLGASQGMGNFMTGRGTANLLTRATAVLGTLFFALSLGLAVLYHNSASTQPAAAILNGPAAPAPVAPPGPAPLPQTPADAFHAPAPTGVPAPGQAPAAPTGGPAAPAPTSPAPPTPGHSGQ
jgi:preprotein translocase subunit SecG